MGLWDELSVDLLTKIEENIEVYQDKVRSRCVCTHWNRVFPELPDLRNQQPPWLLLPNTGGSSLCQLFHPFEKKLLVVDLPEIGEEKVFKGSGHGCVVTVQKDGSINVVNPLTRVRFPLPPRYKFTDVLNYHRDKVGHEYLMKDLSLQPGYISGPPNTYDAEWVRNHSIHKISLSCAPNSARKGDFIAVAMYGETHRLAYCKLGEKKWTDMVKPSEPYSYWDIAFCGGKLYTLNNKKDLMVCDDIVSYPELRMLIPACEGLEGIGIMNLINSLDGGVTAVRRVRGLRKVPLVHPREVQEIMHVYKTVDFEIYKMYSTSSGWIRVEGLACDEILFMDLSSQIGIRGMSGNRIYFNNRQYDDFDNGVFRFEDKEMESHGYELDQMMIFPSPIWVMPNPY